MSWFIYAGVALLVYQVAALGSKHLADKAKPKAKRVASKGTARKRAAELLGVDKDDDDTTIRHAYQKKVRQYHPDVVANAADEIRDLAERRTKALNAAYDLLVKGKA